MQGVRVGFKLVRTLAHVLRGWWIIWRQFPHLAQPQREQHVQRWAAQMLGIFGITLVRHGPPLASGPVLLVANHISWLDILVMHASGYCRFISKADVHHWPLIGTMAAAAGTLFIERESRRDAMRVVHHMAERLSAGDVLAVFPEGTTGDGIELKPFHANLIQAAIAVQAPVQPLALRFIDGRTGELSLAPRFVDEDTLLSSVLKTLGAQDLQAEVISGHVQLCEGRDRRQWAADLREAVEALRQAAH
jgi:1-acyl-sn-glycerol-3-phosphate acyltransferase